MARRNSIACAFLFSEDVRAGLFCHRAQLLQAQGRRVAALDDKLAGISRPLFISPLSSHVGLNESGPWPSPLKRNLDHDAARCTGMADQRPRHCIVGGVKDATHVRSAMGG
jgi:hypothetical protein